MTMLNPTQIPAVAPWQDLGVIKRCPEMPAYEAATSVGRVGRREKLASRPRRHSEWTANLLVDNGSNFAIFSECALILQEN
jgi:hypothetical protein